MDVNTHKPSTRFEDWLTSLQHGQREKTMREVPTIFPTLTQCRTVNSLRFNDFFFRTPANLCFSYVRRAGKSCELKDLRNQTSCLPNFHK